MKTIIRKYVLNPYDFNVKIFTIDDCLRYFISVFNP